jgi:hypothetical protein
MTAFVTLQVIYQQYIEFSTAYSCRFCAENFCLDIIETTPPPSHFGKSAFLASMAVPSLGLLRLRVTAAKAAGRKKV